MKVNNNILLLVATALIGYSLLSGGININSSPSNVEVVKPNGVLLELSQPVIDSIKNQSGDYNKDGNTLAGLYMDIATLIESDNEIIKNTEEIREANKISGTILKLNIKEKYPDFPAAATSLVKGYIGDDNIALSPELRQKSAEAFRALAWACSEGSK